MDLLLAFILASMIAAAVIARVMVWSTHQASSVAITRYFKSAEYILQHHQPPPAWHAVSWRKRVFGQSPSGADMMARLDELIRFFEHSAFFEDEWTRQQLLAQLDEERRNWEVSLFAE